MIDGQIHGRKPSPRALIHGFSDDVATRIAALVPTARTIEYLEDVREEEWDLLITAARMNAADHLYVIAIGASAGRVHEDGVAYPPVAVDRSTSSVATEFVVPNGLSNAVGSLVRSDLLPLAQGEDVHSVMRAWNENERPSLSRTSEFVRPFLTTTEPQILAGSFRRRGDRAECWSLPLGTDPVAWTKAALADWTHLDPERFPPSPDWSEAGEWQSAREIAAVTALEGLEEAFAAAVAEIEQERLIVLAERSEARVEADNGVRRLLTAQGDDLVAATKNALERLGFAVRNMDAVWNSNDHREDLRLRIPEDPDWECVVEVRGYQRGAQLNDLLRIGRFVARYAADEGHLPSAAWYIVNQFLREKPDARRLALEGNAEVAEFATGPPHGLVLDTVELFRLLRAVEDGTLAASTARGELVASTGRFAHT